MANYNIYIEDISGLYENVALVNGLNDILTIGPIKSNVILGYKALEAGYATPALDFSYNLNVFQDAKIGNNLDVYNNLNVMDKGFMNNLVVYNLRNYQFQRLYNGDFSMYVYIDQYYRVYPAYLKNTNGVITVEYLDPFLVKSIYDVNTFDSLVYIHNQDNAINSISKNAFSFDASGLQIGTIEDTIDALNGKTVNFIGIVVLLNNNPIKVYGINPINTNTVYSVSYTHLTLPTKRIV